MFQAKVIKLSRYNIEQRRILVQTGDHIYLFEKQKLNRRHRVTNMAAIIISTVEEEVVLSFPNAKDLRMRGLTRDEINNLQSYIQLRYVKKCPEKTLMIYGVPVKSLKEYSHDNKKYGFINLPDDKYRLRDLELAGIEDSQPAKVKTEEEEANDLFNQTILDEGGRGSIKVGMDDDEFGFEKTTDISSATENILAEIKNDCKRASTLKQRKPGNVKLEDFEIICQLGKGTFGKVYLASLPSTEQ